MCEYDDLLAEVAANAEAFRASARDYIPRMYQALRNENPNLSPADARDRIEKDCVNIWSKRTIIDAIPNEAKDPKKQKAGRLGQKKQYSAAVSAAAHMKKGIVVDTSGQPLIERDDVSPIEEQTNRHNAAISSTSSVDFECSLPFENLRLYMQSIFNDTRVHGDVWIHGTLDLLTGKVTYVSTGRIVKNLSNPNRQGTP